jgi:hypothetical protein
VTSVTTSNAEIGRTASRFQIPSGSGYVGASAVLALLDDATTSPASRCLASARAALGTRLTVLEPRAATMLGRKLSVEGSFRL